MAHVNNGGYQIAYDLYGSGRGTSFLFAQRKAGWERMGYVQRLSALGSKVLVVDPRGYGDSSRARHEDDYSLDPYCDDLLCAADAAGIRHFVAWGYSNTAALALALAGQTDRAEGVACCGIDPYQDFAVWSPQLDHEVETAGEGEYLPEGRFDWRAARAFYNGYTAWQPQLQGQFRCPGVVVCGSLDPVVRTSINHHRSEIDALGFPVHELPELDHQQCVEAVDLVVDEVLATLSLA